MEKRKSYFSLALVLSMIGIISACSEEKKQSLKLNLNTTQITVSGISSGGYMAHQFHIAYSDKVAGAALLASGPYGCAEGDLKTALSNCLNNQSALETKKYLVAVENAVNNKSISDSAEVKDDKVWIFHGSKDETVSHQVVQSQSNLYQSLGAKVTEVFSVPSGHGVPTADQGVACESTKSPFINACMFDSAGAYLNTLFGNLNPKVTDLKNRGKVVAFNQEDFLAKGESNTLAEEGFYYLPQGCSNGTECRVHVAFHGCQQNYETIEQQFIQQNGLNEWAESNNIVVIYPQTTASFVPLNPKACWDWWGYTGADYQARDGKQMKHVYQMVMGL